MTLKQLKYREGDTLRCVINGDNLSVLKDLVSRFQEKVKCVYIDPPYNNGENYFYYSDNKEDSCWLKDLSDIVALLFKLLTHDGSLWISIDDGNMPYLKVALDRVLGRGHFVSTIIWQHRISRENRAIFSNDHEYILVYAKDLNSFKKSRNLLPLPEDFKDKSYKNPDNDPRGPWQSVTLSVQAGHGVPSQFYTITSPTGVKHDPPKGRCWIYNEQRLKKEIEDNNIWFGLDGTGVPRVKKFWKDSKKGLTPETLWLSSFAGTTKDAKAHLLKLFSIETPFDTPKPEKLIYQIFSIATKPGDLVLDCFLGSGSTITTAHKMGRQYIGIEINPESVELVKERLDKVIKGETGGISSLISWSGGGSYQTIKA
jgi:Adenine specific DNA methylase Mod